MDPKMMEQLNKYYPPSGNTPEGDTPKKFRVRRKVREVAWQKAPESKSESSASVTEQTTSTTAFKPDAQPLDTVEAHLNEASRKLDLYYTTHPKSDDPAVSAKLLDLYRILVTTALRLQEYQHPFSAVKAKSLVEAQTEESKKEYDEELANAISKLDDEIATAMARLKLSRD